ncbi:MAG: hypothetical protein ACJ789_00390 [Thermomicrobiales bacterium]
MSMPPDEEIKRDMLARMASKLEASPKSMAWMIAKYKEAEGIDNTAVARFLHVGEEQLLHLALCSRPRVELFNEDIESIADHLSIEQRPLLELVRHVEALESFQYASQAGSSQWLAAARDIAEEPTSAYDVDVEGAEDEKHDNILDDEQ